MTLLQLAIIFIIDNPNNTTVAERNKERYGNVYTLWADWANAVLRQTVQLIEHCQLARRRRRRPGVTSQMTGSVASYYY